MTAARQLAAQQFPPEHVDYRRFPRRTIKAGARWFRQHAARVGPWWFSSSGAGRFDLDPPCGTCYLADSQAATIRERLGPDLARHRAVAESILAGRSISALILPADLRAANLDANRAADQYGITGELTTMTPYDVPRAWARTLHQADFDAIKGRLRFALGRARGLALFGTAGEHADWPSDDSAGDALAVARQMKLRIIAAPDNEQATMAEPVLR